MSTISHTSVSATNYSRSWNRAWGLCGMAAAVLGVLGHLLLPSGFPEDGNAQAQLDWILQNSSTSRVAATLGLIAALLMIVFAGVLGRFLSGIGRLSVLASAAEKSVAVAATVLGLGYLMLSLATWAETAPETGNLVFVPAMVNLGGLLIASAWVFVLPAVVACATSTPTNRVIGIASILGSIAIGASAIIPAVSWLPGAVWLVVVGVGVSLSRPVADHSVEPQAELAN